MNPRRSVWHWLIRCAALAIAAAGIAAAYRLPKELHVRREDAAALLIDRQIGATVEALNDDLAVDLQLPQGSHGLVVTSLAAGRPGDRAGLHAGDVIEQIDAYAISDAESAVDALRANGAGPLHLIVNRAGLDSEFVIVRG